MFNSDFAGHLQAKSILHYARFVARFEARWRQYCRHRTRVSRVLKQTRGDVASFGAYFAINNAGSMIDSTVSSACFDTE